MNKTKLVLGCLAFAATTTAYADAASDAIRYFKSVCGGAAVSYETINKKATENGWTQVDYEKDKVDAYVEKATWEVSKIPNVTSAHFSYWEHEGSVVEECTLYLSGKLKPRVEKLSQAIQKDFPEIKRTKKQKDYLNISFDIEINPETETVAKGITLWERTSTEELVLSMNKRWKKSSN